MLATENSEIEFSLFANKFAKINVINRIKYQVQSLQLFGIRDSGFDLGFDIHSISRFKTFPEHIKA